MKASVTDYAQALYETVKADQSKARVTIERLLLKLQSDRRRHWLPLIVKVLETIEQEQTGQLMVEVESARPLDNQDRQLIKRLVSQRHPDKILSLKKRVEPSLIGGLKLTIQDTVIDYTIQSQLKALGNRF